MNILIPTLAAGGVITEGGLQFDARELVRDLVLDARQARAGDIGLLMYEAEVWERFAASAVEVETRPPRTLGVAAFEWGDGWRLVAPVPDEEEDETVLALWEVAQDDTLAVVSGALPGGGIEPVVSALQWLRDRRERRRLKRSQRLYACANRKSDLGCSVRQCPKGDCVPDSWFDPKYNRTLHGCTCVASGP